MGRLQSGLVAPSRSTDKAAPSRLYVLYLSRCTISCAAALPPPPAAAAPCRCLARRTRMQTDAREVDAAAVPTRLATSRHEAWRDLTTHRVNEYCAGLVVLEKRVQKAEAEALSRSQLPLLMLQSYATAEAQALVVQEQGRKVSYEREQREKKEAAERAVREQQERVQQLAAAQQMAAQQQQQALMMQRQQLLLQQQQQAAAAIAAKQQQQQQASAPKVQQQQQQQQLGVPQQVAQPPGMPLGLLRAWCRKGRAWRCGRQQGSPRRSSSSQAAECSRDQGAAASGPQSSHQSAQVGVL